MKFKFFAGCLATALSSSILAQVPASELAKPPADARHYIIKSTGGKHGDSWSWVSADGKRMGRESLNLRGQVWEMDFIGKPGADGLPITMEVRGITPQGDAAETFDISAGMARWKSPVDGGSAPQAADAFYATQGGPIETTAWFVDRLLAAADHSMALLPGGKAQADLLTTAEIGEGDARRTVKLWSISGVGATPFAVWSDSQDKFFAITQFLAWIPEAYAGETEKMAKVQADAVAKQAPGLLKSLLHKPDRPVVFTNVRLFDADGLKFVPDQTVVVDKGIIVAVGPAKRTRYPKRSIIIDGRGKSLVPGLWDCHMHVSDDYAGIQELSLGVTSVRDPGNNDAHTIDRRTRSASGQLLAPNVYPSSLIDGKGPYTAQVANVATSEAEAVAFVRLAKQKGFNGVKFYGTINSNWLPAAIGEAHKLGLHVHGHVPAGIRPTAAIRAGYDEITHINWVMMEAMPDNVLPVSNGIMRFEAPGRYAKDVDLDGPALSGIVSEMASRKIYSDPTMVAFEAIYVPANGELSPAYAPFVGTLPPSSERGFRSGGFAVPKDLTRADYRASWAKMVGLLGKMHKAGVPIVAGTDGSGIEIVHELEIYVSAGFSPAEALAAATIVPARLVGQDKRTGSIRKGKIADLVLVEGDPSRRIGDLRQTRTVMLGGALLDADALRAASGFSGRPK